MPSYTTGACWWQVAGQPDHMQPLSWEGLRSESLSIHLLSLTNQWLLFLCQTRLTLRVCCSSTGKVVERRKRMGQTERWSNCLSLISLVKQTEERLMVREPKESLLTSTSTLTSFSICSQRLPKPLQWHALSLLKSASGYCQIQYHCTADVCM